MRAVAALGSRMVLMGTTERNGANAIDAFWKAVTIPFPYRLTLWR